MTLMYELDLKIPKMFLHTKNELPRLGAGSAERCRSSSHQRTQM